MLEENASNLLFDAFLFLMQGKQSCLIEDSRPVRLPGGSSGMDACSIILEPGEFNGNAFEPQNAE